MPAALAETDPASLPGWAGDDHAAALAAYALTVGQLPGHWPRPDGTGARRFFETCFRCAAPQDALVTGYYEPELQGSPVETPTFRFPLHGLPPMDRQPWFTRTDLLDGGHLCGRELVWLDDPLEAFLAQVQGSVRVRLPDGVVLRLGYAGKNGQPYRSIGAELVARGSIPATTISTDAIRVWARANPDQVDGLLRMNPSYVFFRLLDLAAETGPLGALGTPVVAGRSVAADPSVPGGALVWLGGSGLNRLGVVQDRGSAITGTRIDLYCGTGAAAGHAASAMKLPARTVALIPKTAT